MCIFGTARADKVGAVWEGSSNNASLCSRVPYEHLNALLQVQCKLSLTDKICCIMLINTKIVIILIIQFRLLYYLIFESVVTLDFFDTATFNYMKLHKLNI